MREGIGSVVAVYLLLLVVFTAYVIFVPTAERWPNVRDFMLWAVLAVLIVYVVNSLRDDRFHRELAARFRNSERTMINGAILAFLWAILPIPARYSLPVLWMLIAFSFYRTYKIRLEEMGYKS